jgi:hypothetical protein
VTQADERNFHFILLLIVISLALSREKMMRMATDFALPILTSS